MNIDRDIQVVICTAYSDYSWKQMIDKLGQNDRFVVLKKPFDVVEVRQLVQAMTEKWSLSRQKERMLEDLERKVHERTEQLEDANIRLKNEMEERLRLERNLRQAQKLEALGQLTAGISHEINNPLTYVQTNLDFCLQELNESDGRLTESKLSDLLGMLKEASEGATRIGRIIRDVRLFSHPGESEKTSVDPEEILETAVKICGNEILHSAHLEKDFQGTSKVVGDRRRLEQVFVNLLMNAVQAVRDQPYEGLIRIVTSNSSDGSVCVEIQDNGHGIAPEIADRVFEPFFTTRPIGQGTGLGLSICNSVVNSLGGKFELVPHDGGGTLARVSLMVFDEAEQTDSTPTEAAATAAQQPEYRKASILIVDDEPCVAHLIERLLSMHDTYAVNNIDQALEHYDSKSFDLVLLDLMMPGRDGMDFFKEMEKRGPDHTKRIVFMTGGAFTPTAREFLAGNKNACIEKPFSMEHFIAIVNARISDQQGTQG